MKTGLWCIRLVQSFFILGVCIFSYKLIKSKDDTSGNLVKVAIIIMLYASIGLTTFNEGIFWFSASMGYVWALCPLVAAIYCQKRFHDEGTKKYLLISSILFFFAGFSYEQIAVMTVVYVVFYYVMEWAKKRRYIKGSITILISAILGSGFEILAPGNFVRAGGDANAEFYQLSFFEKIQVNLPKVLDVNLGVDNKITVIFFLISGIMVSYMLYKKSLKKTTLYKINMLVGCVFSLLAVVTWWHEGKWYVNLSLVLWILWYCVNVTMYLYNKHDFLLALFYGGMCSVGMMVVSPTIPARCHIPFEFVMHIVVAFVMVEFFNIKRKKIQTVILVLMAVLSLYNIVPITIGYYNNSKINEINHNKLIEKSAKINAGMDIESIILYRLYDDRFASQMPYQQSFIEYWLRNYYEIPQDVRLIWENLDSLSTSNEMVVTETPRIVSLYPEKIDDNTSYNDDGSVNIGVTVEVITPNLIIYINGQKYATVIDEGFISTAVPPEVLQESFEISVYDTTSGKFSESVIMETVEEN